jgi:putative intracellular protease/amidase
MVGCGRFEYYREKADLRNAGAEVLDEEAVADGNLVTSRRPKDIPGFNRVMIKLFAGARGHFLRGCQRAARA